MRKIIKFSVVTFICAIIVMQLLCSISNHIIGSDANMRSKVVMLVSGMGSCSGEQIVAPSGHTYILTAGHCKDLNQGKGSITVRTADGKVLERAIIAEDLNSDLLLLEGIPNTGGLDVADTDAAEQHVRTFTHGAGLRTYKTEGVIIQDKEMSIMLGIMGSEFRDKCEGYKFRQIDLTSERGEAKACVLMVLETVTTAMVVPGSSGGPVVDDAGDLIGVVSATDGSFGYLVTLTDIRKFIANY